METNTHSSVFARTRKIVIMGMLSAISVVLSMTPIGYIPIPPINPTIMHIPVIVAALIEGPVVGVFVGLIFGMSSLIKAFTQPSPLTLPFQNPLVSVLPRILIGLTAYYVYKAIKTEKSYLKIGFSTAAGSLTNTIGVLGMIYLFYLRSNAGLIALGTVFIQNGIPEVIVSVLITAPIVIAVKKSRR